MADELRIIVVVSGVAAMASVAGGLLALWHRASTLISSLAFGFAGGALIATVTLEMLPTALELGELAIVVMQFPGPGTHAIGVPIRLANGWGRTKQREEMGLCAMVASRRDVRRPRVVDLLLEQTVRSDPPVREASEGPHGLRHHQEGRRRSRLRLHQRRG